MFFIISRQDYTGMYSVHSTHLTLEEAAKARRVSGDLVCGVDHMPVADEAWLWDFEKADPTSYAKRMIHLVLAGKFVVGRQLPSLMK